MDKLTSLLRGKKTYIVAALVGILAALNFLGIVDNEAYSVLLGLLGAGGIAALRAGMKKN